MYAPIVVFCYNRLHHLNRTLEALGKNLLAKESDLFICMDGPRNTVDTEIQFQIVDMLKSHHQSFKTMELKRNHSNLGLANSIITGVSSILEKYNSIIVLEDDMVTSPYFLKYLNDGLSLYEKESKVCSVHAYFYPISNKLPETFFLRGADCWGWATWKRAWSDFVKDGKTLSDRLEDSGLIHEFNFDGSYDYYKMLQDQIAKRNDSWAIRWHASNFLQNKLTLYPNVSLVKNIGLDGSGTHCDSSDTYDTELKTKPVDFFSNDLSESIQARKALKNFFLKSSGQNDLTSKLKRLFKGLNIWN